MTNDPYDFLNKVDQVQDDNEKVLAEYAKNMQQRADKKPVKEVEVPRTEEEFNSLINEGNKTKINRNSSHEFLQPPSTKKDHNPLSSFFRSAETYVRLPSNGQFNDKDSFELTVDGRLAIFPMTANDELTLRSPDALLNGAALEQIIKSCAPGIKNVRTLCSPDFDVILLAIRSVSIGEQIDYETVCPKCEHENAVGFHIPTVLESIRLIDGSKTVTLNSKIELNIHPYTFESNMQAAIIGFEEGQMIKNVFERDIPENEKMAEFTKSLSKIASLSNRLFTEAIQFVKTPDGTIVDSKEHISEFLINISKPDNDIITKAISSLNEDGFDRIKKINCSKCNEEYDLEISYDPSAFFPDSF